MTRKNYYFILGISPNASTEGIRNAFRQMAKKYHPDKAGKEQTANFQDITEAYEVLSDPEKRKEYNNTLTKDKNRERPFPFRHTPQQKDKNKNPFASYSVQDQFENNEHHHPSSGVNIHQKNSYQNSTRSTAGNLVEMDAYLTPEEAFSGTTICFNIPFDTTCRWCGGSGIDFIFDCFQCHGTGFTTRQKMVEISLPPHIKNGTRIQTSIILSGENHLHLLIHVHII